MQYNYVINAADGAEIGIARISPMDSTGTVRLWSLLVHKPFRGKGYGSILLRRVCRDADREGVHLRLSVAPSSGSPLDHAELTAFYGRYGFVSPYPDKAIMIRRAGDQEPVVRQDMMGFPLSDRR